MKFAPRIQAATKIELKSELIPSLGRNQISMNYSKNDLFFPLDDSNEQIYPACIFNDWGVSKTFLIIYKNEEVDLDDQFNFKLSVILDAQNVRRIFPSNRKKSFYLDCRLFQSIGYATMYRTLFY